MSKLPYKSDLEWFIKLYVPKGWICAIHTVDFAPLISDEEYKSITQGKIPRTRQYNKWYVHAAIRAWWAKNNLTILNDNNVIVKPQELEEK